MLRKRIALFLLTVAYAILLGHNNVPHHHHDTDHDLTAHHHNDHHDNSDHSSKDFDHLYSHFIHSDIFITANNDNKINIFSKQLFLKVAVSPTDFFLCDYTIQFLLHKLPEKTFIYISPHSLSSGLRAPPAFIA
ncbi:MAG: hypothetical protein A3F72_00535 [Bacteroidetes bacterium RIFCSPLOWO2_12_FULL_35_15]|nr:MAG: hypothetical protein A3F72_00535 [Bacteroidetes bacterium RIFCSPLOWO2_12_FULL_35_15]